MTVFQAEITAIARAALDMIDANITGRFVNFYIDSQAAIKALDSYMVRLKSVADGKRILNKLAEQGNAVTLNWIPGHSGQPGNEIADHLAKRGADLEDVGSEPRLPVSGCVTKEVAERWKNNEHTKKWEERSDCRQSKLVLPYAEHEWKNRALSLERDELKVVTQLVTGHANLKRHRHVMGLEENELCQFCGESQTSIHILTECPEFYELRKSKFGERIISENEIKHNKLVKIVQFARGTGLWNCLGGP